MQRWGAIGPTRRRARRFGSFGAGSIMCFPWQTLYGERWMRVGADTMIGPFVTLSVGLSDDQVPIAEPVITIGDRCLINKGTAIVASRGITALKAGHSHAGGGAIRLIVGQHPCSNRIAGR